MIRCTADAAPADLSAVLQLCDAGRVRCSEKTRRPSAATVALVGDALTSGDFYPDEPIAAFAWPLLIQTGGLTVLAGSRLQLTPRGRRALDRPTPDVVRALWRAWVARGLIDVDYDDPAGARDDFRDNWGSDELAYLSRHDGLRAIRLNPLGAHVLDAEGRPGPS